MLRKKKAVFFTAAQKAFWTLLPWIAINSSLKAEEELYLAQKKRQAEELFETTSYGEAALLYEGLLCEMEAAASQRNALQAVRYQLALSHYLNGNFLQSLAVLESSLVERFSPSLYLAAMAYKELKQWDKAAVLLENCLHLQEEEQWQEGYPVSKSNIHWQLACIYFQKQEFSKAKGYFQSLLKEKENCFCDYAELFLARITIEEGDYCQAEELFSLLQLKASYPLRYEVAYFCGQLSFLLQEYEKASFYFEEAIPKRNLNKAPWSAQALYYLGCCALKNGDDSTKPIEEQKRYFDKAEKAFQLAMELSKEEKIPLALAYSYLIRGRRLKEEKALMQAQELLNLPQLQHLSLPGKEALPSLLRMEAAISYGEREKLYRQITLDTSSLFYAKGIYARALNDLEEGKHLMQQQGLSEGEKLLDRAIAGLSKAAELLKREEPCQAVAAIRYQAEAYALKTSPEALSKALALIDELLATKESLPTDALINIDELYYLKGLVVSQMALESKETRDEELAIRTLKEGLLQDKPTAKTFHLLATLLFNKGDYAGAKTLFLAMTTQFPGSSFAGDGYFWAARAAENLKEEPEEAKKLKRALFEKYPCSAYAEEAYFSYYPYEEYLRSDPAAIKHLESMTLLYPDSLYLLNAYYLLGLDRKKARKQLGKKRNWVGAVDAFQQVETLFDKLYEQAKIPEARLDHSIEIKYRSMIERAYANLAIAEESQGAKQQICREYAIDLLQQIMRDFEKPNHPLTKRLMQGGLLHPLYEESYYALAVSYRKANEEEKAHKMLEALLEKYRIAKISRGYFLSKALYEQATIAMQQSQWEPALQLLSAAEDAGKGKILNPDEKLDLWIQQSSCLKALNQLDKAMLILSKAVNEDAISSLRLKAMYLRSEIYTCQGRHELARKQLQALANKGGEWANKAKETLQREYNYP